MPQCRYTVILEPGLANTRRNRLRRRIEDMGFDVQCVAGGEHDYLEVTGMCLPLLTLSPQKWEGVQRVVPLASCYPHASWGAGRGDLVTPTRVTLGNDQDSVHIGAGYFTIVGGPCSVESRESCLELAEAVKSAGAQAFRGGAFKPRTSPYAFQGLEDLGLEILAEVKEQTALPIVTEIMTPEDIGKLPNPGEPLLAAQQGESSARGDQECTAQAFQHEPCAGSCGATGPRGEMRIGAEDRELDDEGAHRQDG